MNKMILMTVAGLVAAGTAVGRTWQDGLALSYSEGTNTMPYRLYLPYAYNDATNYPMVLFLHGSGEVGTDNNKQVSVHIGGLIEATYSNYPALLVAPQMNDSYWWSPNNPRDLTRGILAHVRRHYAVDERRLYVTGLSMGGFGTTYYAMAFPSMFAALAPMSGAYDNGIMWAGTRLAEVPTWLFHGSMDNTVTNAYSRTYYTNVSGLSTIIFTQTNYGYPTAVSGPIRYTELTGQGHNIWRLIYSNPPPPPPPRNPSYNLIYANAANPLYDWMFSQTRPPAASVMTGIARSGNASVISAVSDVPFASGYLMSTTNVSDPMSQWQCLSTNSFDADGSITFTHTPTNDLRRFYRVKIP